MSNKFNLAPTYTVDIQIEGTIDESLAQRVASLIRNESNNNVSLKVGICAKRHGFIIGSEDLNLASAIASIISTFVALHLLWIDSKKRNTWDTDKILAKVKETMLRYGVSEYDIENVEGVDSLLKGGAGPCVISIKNNKSNENSRIYIFRNGNVYRTMIK